MEKYRSKDHKMLTYPYRGSGEAIRFPVGEICGAEDGPTLALVAGVHGSEFCGTQAVIEVFRKTDPAKLKGKLIAVPIYNLPAFLNHAGFVVPLDGKNPMRTFPGRTDGTFSEVMAYHFLNYLLDSKPDFLIELHGGDIPEALVPYIMAVTTGNPALDARIKTLAEVYNISWVIHADASKPMTGPGSMYRNMAANGVPAILTESGQQGILDFDYVKIHETGITNVMKKMGMIEGDPVLTEKIMNMENGCAVRCEKPGLWYPFVKLRQMVKKDEKIGEIREIFGDLIADVRSPMDGIVTVIRTSPSVEATQVLVEINIVL